MRMLSFIAVIVIGFYAVILVYFYFNQANLVYFPPKNILAEPKHIGLASENVYLVTEDGVKINGWFVPAKSGKAKDTVLFFHGNAGNISNCLDIISIYAGIGFNVFIIDYRGYGRSEGVPSEKGTYTDAETAYNWLVSIKKTDPDNIIIAGRSLGGAVAAWLASKYPCKALVIESAFTSVNDLGAEIYPFLPVRLLSKFKYDTREYVKEVRAPVLIVHSKDDEMIPFRHGKELFAAAPGPKKFLPISGTHNEGYMTSSKEYEEGIASFIK